MNKKYHSFIFFIAALCIVIISSSFILSKSIHNPVIYSDESGWITSAYYYTDLLLKRDFDPEKWEGSQLDTWGSSYNLHVAQWLMGLPLKRYSARTTHEFSNLYNVNKTLKENKALGNIPPKDILSVARSVSVFFGVLCCVLVLSIGYYARNVWVGLIAAGLLMTNQLFVTLASMAMADIYYNFFLLCACLLLILFSRSSQATPVLAAFLCGIFAGLAASVKIVGIIIVGLLFFMYLIYKSCIIKRWGKNIIYGGIIFSLSAVFTICILSPSLWNADCLKKIFLMFIDWNNLLNIQADTYVRGWGNDRLWVLHKTLVLKYSNFSFEWILLCGGVISAAAIAIRSLYRKQFARQTIPFLLFLINYLFILLFMKISWNRYYLPTVIAGKFIIACFLYDALCFFYQSMKKKLMISNGRSVMVLALIMGLSITSYAEERKAGGVEMVTDTVAAVVTKANALVSGKLEITMTEDRSKYNKKYTVNALGDKVPSSTVTKK